MSTDPLMGLALNLAVVWIWKVEKRAKQKNLTTKSVGFEPRTSVVVLRRIKHWANGNWSQDIFRSFIIKWKNVSCEIEDFVETRLCKLNGILRSRVLRVSCNLIKLFSPYCRGINDHTWLGESGKLFLVIGYKIWVGNGGVYNNVLRNAICMSYYYVNNGCCVIAQCITTETHAQLSCWVLQYNLLWNSLYSCGLSRINHSAT